MFLLPYRQVQISEHESLFLSVHFQIHLLDSPHLFLEAAQYTYILLKILQKGRAILYLPYAVFHL